LSWYRNDPNYVYAVVETERTGQEPENAPFMGIRGEDAEVGARLTEVTEGGPAAAAELATGDIVLQIDGQPVTSYQDLLAKVRRYEAGQTVKMQISRNREVSERSVTFTTRPQPAAGSGNANRG